jgi:hypothetical protein
MRAPLDADPIAASSAMEYPGQAPISGRQPSTHRRRVPTSSSTSSSDLDLDLEFDLEFDLDLRLDPCAGRSQRNGRQWTSPHSASSSVSPLESPYPTTAG